MLNKTLRSVLSLAVVFCLLLGMSGNAIVLAATNPVDDAFAEVDQEVYGTIGELNATIDDLEDQIDELEDTLLDGEQQLLEGKEKLAEAKQMLADVEDGDLKEGNEKLAEAKQMLADVEDMLRSESLYEDNYASALDSFKASQEYADAKAEALQELYNELLNEARASQDYADAKADVLEEVYNEAYEEAKAEAMAEAGAAFDEATFSAEFDEEFWNEFDQAEFDAEFDNAFVEEFDEEFYSDGNQAEFESEFAEAAEELFKEEFDEQFAEKIAEAEAAVADAKAELAKAEAYVANVNEAIAGYKATIAHAELEIAEAELLIADAKTTIAVARNTVANARELVDGAEKTYTDLRNAVANPEMSVAFVEKTVVELNANYVAAWNALLQLDQDIDDLIAAYDALAQYEIDAITVAPFYQEEVKINSVWVELADGEKVGFDGMTLPEVKVDYSFTFEGIVIPEKPETLTTLDETLAEAIETGVTLNVAMATFVEIVEDIVAEANDLADEVLNFEFDANIELDDAMVGEVYDWLYNNPAEVCALVEEYGVYALDMLVKYGPYALDLLEEHSDLVVISMVVVLGATVMNVTLGAAILGYVGTQTDFLNDYKIDVAKAAAELYAEYGDEAEALVEVYVEYLGLRERFYNATHADYTIFHDSLYLAIGDGTALPGGYADKLAEMMGISHMSANLAQIDMTVEEAIALVKQQAELVGKADLITLGFSNIPASFDVLNALVADYESNMDAEIELVAKDIDAVLAEVKAYMIEAGLGQEEIALVDEAGALADEALVALRNRLVAEGVTDATVEMVMSAAEAYAVAYISRAAWYPCLVHAIQKINPDAQIVIVGTYNDMEGVVLDVNGNAINVGEYINYMTAAANLENLAQAFFGEGVIYVHASAVETVFEEYAYENLNNLGYLMSIMNDEMLPSEAGHAYIAEQIYNALNVKYCIWGDVNGDNKVTCRDARLILKYIAGTIDETGLNLTLADVNGDGMVTTRDARLILKLITEQIEHFPVCELSEA